MKHLPVIILGLRVRVLCQRHRWIDAELPVLRRTIFCGLQLHLARTAEHLLKNRNNGSQVIECKMPTEPANEFQQIILHVGSSLFCVWKQGAGSDPTLSIKTQRDRWTRTDDESGQRVERIPSSTVIVAVIVDRKVSKNGGESRDMANPLQERELDKKTCCQLGQYGQELEEMV